MASLGLERMVDKLITTLENEASCSSGAPDEIQEIKLLLKSITSFLVDADRAGENTERQKAWVSSVRELAYEVEDVVDEFTYHLNRQRQGDSLGRSLRFPKNLFVRHEVATKLRDINKRKNNLTERAHEFGVQLLEERCTSPTPPSFDPTWKNRLSETSFFCKDGDLVGIKKSQHELLGWLLDTEARRTVISVVGMGGSGKTCLVANTFNKEIIRQHFEFQIWITVSEKYAIEELLRSMVKEFYQKTNEEVPILLNSMSYRELVVQLLQRLQPKRYLIVLDDVWSTSLWQDISIALPEGLRGSRIMLTTRKEDLAPSQFEFISYIHQIRPLKQDEAWELFCRTTFPNNNDVVEMCPLHLDSLARNMVEKCEGLPLAIKALGGLMSSKKSIGEWKKVYDNLNWELSCNPALDVVKSILMVSYHDLPFQLKRCFLYCCIFPEDYEVQRKRLIRLLMAEGFVEHVKDAAPEIVSESYLVELVVRSLLQVAQRNAFGRPKTFKVHDVLRELGLSISKVENFFSVLDGIQGVIANGVRRCSIEANEKVVKSVEGASQLRSLFIFVDERVSSSSNKLPSGLKYLRVLDLEDAPIDELPSDLGNLFNLRYLNLTRTCVKSLPKSIGNLFDLQSLILKGAEVVVLPAEIGKLQNLRHLTAFVVTDKDRFSYRFSGIRVPQSICMINKLQVLSFVAATNVLVKQLKKMTQIKTLGLANVVEAYEKDLCSSIAKMEHLQNLHLFAPSGVLKMDALPLAPPCLEKLFLNGEMEHVPHWFNGLYSLTHLTLQNSLLGEDLISHIQPLPNLSSLTLGDAAYNKERLCFFGGFQRLKYLEVFHCNSLKEILIENEAMPGLQDLYVRYCKVFTRFTYGLNQRTHLQKVCLLDVADDLINPIGEEWEFNGQGMRGVSLTRRDDDDEDESKWFYKYIC